MDLSELLKPEAVKVVSSASSKKRLLQDLADLAGAAYGLDASLTNECLVEREGLGPTGVGNGVALPHARMENLEQVVGAFVLLERPVDFHSVDRQPVDLIFGLFAPKDAGAEHLKSLAAVSRTLRDPEVCGKLRANPDPSTLFMILTALDNQQAA
jgi:PTS system nitrogen regulatory IIA component